MLGTQIRLLNRLARAYGIETSFRDYKGCRRHAGPESLLAVLRALGAPVESLGDVSGALREYYLKQWQQCCEPVTVAWEGNTISLKLRLSGVQLEHMAVCRLKLEDGRAFRWNCRLAGLPVLESVPVAGMVYQVSRLDLPLLLPLGYHRLFLDLPGCTREILIISAPRHAYIPPGDGSSLTWGAFLPLYALHSRKSWGAGDFTDLETLQNWVHGLGGTLVGTLPLLSAFLEEPFSPSPYEPVSRLFWNEFYLDVTRVPEFKGCSRAVELFESEGFKREIAELRAMTLVDYRRVMAVKRKILEICARNLFAGASGRLAGLLRWVEENPTAGDYARFRAAVERRRAGWTAWPGQMREGFLSAGDFDPEDERYHLYVQWLAREQLREMSEQFRRNGRGLYLDLPLGVHREGYDVWRRRSAFALDASSGAPPDGLNSRGQNWGFPPLHPQGIREQGYRYFIDSLRHHLQHAGALRLDHVMGLHHLYWVPAGMTAREGVYVRYRAGEFYAILALESRRHRSLLVGEDLGVVPDYVRTAMARHRIHRMYILPFEGTGKPSAALRPVPPGCLAGLNTHDMPPFASYWLRKKKDDLDRAALPVFLRRQGRLKFPTTKTKAILRASLAFLAGSKARVLQVNLEDLWMETAPQNVPGTTDEYPNWRLKARYALEEFTRQPEVLDILTEVDFLRKTGNMPDQSQSSPASGGGRCLGQGGDNHEL